MATDLRRWARSRQDAMLAWGEDVPDELCAALVHDARHEVSDWLVRMLAAEQIAVSLAVLSRRVAAIVGEHAAPAASPGALKRWARGDR